MNLEMPQFFWTLRNGLTIILTSTPWLATILPLLQQRLGRVFQFMTERIFRSLVTGGLWYGFHKNFLLNFIFRLCFAQNPHF